MDGINKKRVLQKLVDTLKENHRDLRHFASVAAAEAVHEESRPENSKDTRGLETSYLARGQAMRIVELEEAIKRIEYMPVLDFSDGRPIASSALVKLLRDGTEELMVLLCPCGGGVFLEENSQTIRVVGAQAPLGRALLGKCIDDWFEITLNKVVQEFEVLAVL